MTQMSDTLQPSSTTADPRQDIVADYPQEIALYAQEQGALPEDLDFEPGYYCRWQGRTFIHTRATLPLHAIDDGVGFGLWVEIDPSEFERYLAAQQDDALYKQFKTEGLLANSWPGFMDTFNLPVTVRTVRVEEKIYITEVHLDRMRDVLFEVALTAQQADTALREQILNLVQAWMDEVNGVSRSKQDEQDEQEDAFGEAEGVNRMAQTEVSRAEETGESPMEQATSEVEQPAEQPVDQFVKQSPVYPVDQFVEQSATQATEQLPESANQTNQPVGEQVVFEQPPQSVPPEFEQPSQPAPQEIGQSDQGTSEQSIQSTEPSNQVINQS